MRERQDWPTGVFRQFVSFGSIGLVNTLIGYAVILFVSLVLGANPYFANACGYAVGLLISFALNRRYTFSSHQAIFPGLARFFAAFAPSYALNLAVLYLGVNWLSLPEVLAQAAAIAIYTLVFFLLCRFFVFHPARPEKPGYAAKGEAPIPSSPQPDQGDAR